MTDKKLQIRNSTAEFLIFTAQSGGQSVEVHYENDTIWLTQKLMAGLFQVTPQNITQHLKSIYQEGELNESATCKDFLQVQMEGKREVSRKQRITTLMPSSRCTNFGDAILNSRN